MIQTSTQEKYRRQMERKTSEWRLFRMLNQIHHGDCLEIMKGIPDASVDLILCDLPFGVTKNSWDRPIPFESLWREYKRITKPNGAIVLHAVDPFTSDLIQSNKQMYKCKWIWDKSMPTGFLNAKRQPLRVTEDILVFYNGQCTYNPQMVERGKPRRKGSHQKGTGTSNYGDLHGVETYNNLYYPTNIIRVSNARQAGKINPTQKPVELAEYIIKTYSNPGDTVLDNCIGSGTTAVAAIRTGRQYIGIEKDGYQFEKARERVGREGVRQ